MPLVKEEVGRKLLLLHSHIHTNYLKLGNCKWFRFPNIQLTLLNLYKTLRLSDAFSVLLTSQSVFTELFLNS